ncbi:MAG: putative phage tail protein, partial [Pseudomonadota bacterium]
MGMTADDYLSQLQALLPQGPAWTRDADAVLTRLLDAMAQEFARIDARADQVIDEADPRTTEELLTGWERVAGLSATSPLDGSQMSVDQRRSNLLAKLVERGGQSPAYFIQLAARMGFTITITEFKEWSVDDSVDEPLYGTDWNFAWQVNAPLVTAQEWSVN